jgi:anti-sigma B factor antagonist
MEGNREMEIRSRTVDGIEIIELEGRFDAFHVPVVSKWFDEHPEASNVIVDLGGVTFIDSLGLSTLVKGLKRCRQHQGDVYLCNLQQAVLMVFELTRLNQAFTILQDAEAALDAFKNAYPSQR